MPSAALFISFLQAVAIVGSALTVIKLLSTRLFRRYRIFFGYFVVRVIYMTALLVISHLKGLPGGDGIRSNLYFYLYLFTAPLLLLAYILVVIELYGLVLERYRGLYTLGRWAMYGAIVISGTISFLTMLPKLGPSLPEPSRWLGYVVAGERAVDFALVIFIILIVWFLSKYPVPLSRNVVVHTIIYAVFFLCDSMVLMWRTLFGYQVTGGYNVLFAAISSACSLAWAFLLTAKGEEIRTHMPEIRPEAEARILNQLDALNATLLKVSRK